MNHDRRLTAQPLTAEAFDHAFVPRNRPTLWGIGAIARYLGVSHDKVRKLARHPQVPINKPEGSGAWCAEPDDLDAWKRGRTR